MQTISFQVDDLYYQELVEQVGVENVADFFKKLSEPYFLLNKKIRPSDNLSEPHKQILSERLDNYAKDGNKGKPYKTALNDIRAKLGNQDGI